MSRDFRSLYIDDSPRSWFIEVDDYYLQSSVSYYGLNQYVPNYSRASQIIKGRRVDTSSMSKDQVAALVDSCKMLYGLLHQRFICSEDGIKKLYSKYQRGIYGKCPRVACNGRNLIPMGFHLEPNKGNVKLWCPSCHDVYKADREIDGAFFGPDLPIIFHKISDIPLKFKMFSNIYQERKDEEGKIVPKIQQRLYRWGEKKP